MLSRIYSLQYNGRQWLTARGHALKKNRAPLPDLRAEGPRRLLIIATGLIGDTVMSTPAIVEARRLWPAAEITLLGRRRNIELLSACPMIDQFKEVAALPFSLRRRGALRELKAWMGSRSFDAAIILLGDEFAPMLAEADIPVRVGVRGHLLEPCLTHSYDIKSPRLRGPDEMLNALRCLGFDLPESPPRLWVAKEARNEAMRKLGEMGIEPGDGFVALHPFGSTRRQWWPLARVPLIAERLRDRYGLKTVLIGGPETRRHAGRVAGADVKSAAGLLKIPELLAVIERAGLVISTDSGPFHIAGALGRPLVGLFRARRPEHAARYCPAKVVLGEQPGCEMFCEWVRCRSMPCLQLEDISADDVARAVSLLAPALKSCLHDTSVAVR